MKVLTEKSEASSGAGPVSLIRDDRGLALVGQGMELRGDFTRMLPRLRQGRLQQELLVKAARVKGANAPTAVDCTAGLGEDSLLLAAAGFTVTLFERDETIAALLADALERAAAEPRLAHAVLRMSLVVGERIAGLASLSAPPEVVYLDLVEAALAAYPRKVVIKRPAKGALLAGMKPSYSVCGKAVRYDVLVPPRAGE